MLGPKAKEAALQERIEELEAQRLAYTEGGEDAPLALLQTLAILREEAGQQPHFGGTMPHRWEWLNLHPEGRIRWYVYCALVREVE